jgi:MoaA/NifB/PqqE/SkfB family radical SAM enzyme
MAEANQPTFAYKSYYLSQNLTLVNDSCSTREVYFLRDPDQGKEHRLDEGDYRLLAFLTKPRRYHQIREYYEVRLPHELRSPDRIECSLDKYLERFLEKGLVQSGRGDFPQNGDGSPIHVPYGMIEAEGKRRVHAFPTTAAFCPTNRCNLACRHCSQGAGRGWRKDGELSREEIAELFCQLEQGGLHDLRITGGEPVVRRDFAEILEEAAKKRFALYLFTNGTMLNKSNVKRIAAVKDQKNGNFLVHLSLDGGTRRSHEWLRQVPGSFDRLVKGMRLLREHDIPFYCEMNLNRRNMGTIEQAVKLLIREGAGSLSMHTSSSAGRAADYDDFFLSLNELRKGKIHVNRLRRKYRGKIGIRYNSYNFPIIAIGERHFNKRDKNDQLILTTVEGKSVTENPLDPCVRARCNAGVGQFTIGADGKVYPCPNCFDIPEFEAGDAICTSARSASGSNNAG